MVNGVGSVHEPAFLGYVGRNMVDACAVGEIFTYPPALAFYYAIRAANGGKGVTCLYGNYAGDRMNVKAAIKMAEKDGIEVKTVVANDDMSSAPKDQAEKRRGVAGEVRNGACAGVQEFGGAKPSDNTLIDALHPADEVFQEAAARKQAVC